MTSLREDRMFLDWSPRPDRVVYTDAPVIDIAHAVGYSKFQVTWVEQFIVECNPNDGKMGTLYRTYAWEPITRTVVTGTKFRRWGRLVVG